MVAQVEKPALALVRDAYRFIEDVQEDRGLDFDDAYGDSFDEGFELLPPASYPEGAQVFRGRAGLKRWIAGTREVWDEWRLKSERMLVSGDQVLVLTRIAMKGHLSGVRLDRRTAHVWDIAGDRVTRCEIFFDRAEALRVLHDAA